MLPKGTYKARATEAEFGFTNTGTEQVAVVFEVVEDGEFQGERIAWFGFFTEATAERTIQALRVCGWTGDDLGDLSGFDANEVELVVEHEEYQGKTTAKVKWVNKIGNRVVLKHKMTDAQRAELAKRMKGLAISTRKPAAASPAPAQNKPATKSTANGKGYPEDWDTQGL